MAVGLFATSVFFYVSQRKLLLPPLLPWARPCRWKLLILCGEPYPALHYVAFVLCWLVSIMASAQLVRFAWGRASVGRWLLAAMLVLLHLDAVGGVHQIVGTDLMVDLLLGISMMTIVLEDSRIQVQRLDALNTITHQISDSREFDPTVGTILEELRRITRAKAAWFRMLEGDKLGLPHTAVCHRLLLKKLRPLKPHKA